MKLPEKAYLIAVDMGYGHQRALYPLLGMAAVPKRWNMKNPIVISANLYPDIPLGDKIKWDVTKYFYYLMSRWSGLPLLGKRFFRLMNYVEKIESFYPRRDLSRVTLSVKIVDFLVS